MMRSVVQTLNAHGQARAATGIGWRSTVSMGNHTTINLNHILCLDWRRRHRTVMRGLPFLGNSGGEEEGGGGRKSLIQGISFP